MKPVIRDAAAADVPAILRLVKELASFERAPEAVVATEADLLRDGFGPAPRFRCRLLDAGDEVIGFTLWFYNYSTWEGSAGLYLEDLYVTEAARGRGYGKALLQDLAAIAAREGLTRLDLSVLDWNPARKVYERLGLRHKKEWLPYRIEGAALRRLAEGAD